VTGVVAWGSRWWQAVGVPTRLVHLVIDAADPEGSEFCLLSPL
jgi:hypothetical protein